MVNRTDLLPRGRAAASCIGALMDDPTQSDYNRTGCETTGAIPLGEILWGRRGEATGVQDAACGWSRHEAALHGAAMLWLIGPWAGVVVRDEECRGGAAR